MTQIFISIGSNIDRENNIRAAVQALTGRYPDLALSSVFESEAVGFTGENFYNLVAACDTKDSMEQVRDFLDDIEQQQGRKRDGERFAPRTLDLDLLLYGDSVRHDEMFDVPRGEIQRYAFVLQPLAEIVPHSIHPELKKSYAQLWGEFDKQEQAIWKTDFRAIGL